MWNDVRFAIRTLRRSPVFTAVAVLSVALGIGANTSIFSLLYQVLYRMLPVRDPESLVVFHTPGQAPGMSMADNHEAVLSYPMYKDLRDRNAVFSGVIARSGSPVSVGWQGQTERATAEMVSGNLFDVLGVPAFLGRAFTQSDDLTPGGHPVAMLTYGYWMRRFGGRPEVLNQKIVINGNPMVVVGVASPSYRGLVTGNASDLFVPVNMQRAVMPLFDGLADRRIRFLNVFARLKPGVNAARAEAAMQPVWRPLLKEDLAAVGGRMRSKRAEEEFLGWRLQLLPAAQGVNQMKSRWETPLVALMAMVGLVLLIACANVANLLIARAAGRRKEIAIRLAIGGSRAAIARQLLVESLLVALAGGLLGLALSRWTTQGLLAMLPGDTGHGWLAPQTDLRILGFALALSLATGLLFGLGPVFESLGTGVSKTLKEQAAAASGGHQARLRRGLVVAQISLSLLLLIGAGLFLRTFRNLVGVDLGFRSERLLTFSVNTALSGYSKERSLTFYGELRQRLAALPGVTAAGAADPGPLSGDNRAGNITVEGYQAKGDEEPGASFFWAGPDYFRAMGIPLLAGREFTERDDSSGPKVAIVNQQFARRYMQGANPIGRHVSRGNTDRKTLDMEIVGVVRNSKHGGLREDARPALFTPYAQDDRPGGLSFFLRAARDENQLAGEVRRLVRELDPNLPVFRVQSMETRVGESLFAERMIAVLSSAFGVLATLLAALGLYGVVAYTVTRRTAEIGVRLALGALPRDVLWMVVREAGLMALAGVAIGVPAALALGRFVESQLFGLKAADPPVFVAAALALAVIALVAALVPGRRAARIDPMRALRYE